jgi:hypothetical protein
LIQGLLITPVEAVMSAFEQSNENPKPSFSLRSGWVRGISSQQMKEVNTKAKTDLVTT